MLRFGTDGVRGEAFSQLTVEYVRALGAAAAQEFGVDRLLIARDTRESGPELERAFAEGLASQGVRAESLGVAPTPALAYLAATDQQAAAMISASHNPYVDNGIKLFAVGGLKLDDATQDRLQARIDANPTCPAPESPAELVDRSLDVSRYEAFVAKSIGNRDLADMSVVLDCANGSNSYIGGRVLRALGAAVTVLHADPDGRNINAQCGSTYPRSLQDEVILRRADLGLAFDGDADRVLAVDHEGRLIDGDQMMAICALDMDRRGVLSKSTVVVTVMTNLGFRIAMETAGVSVIETGVGDRYVLEALERHGLNLGGEQSGHVIFRDLATTGDGLLTAVQLIDVVKRGGSSLKQLADESMTSLPQVLANTTVAGDASGLVEKLAPAVARVEAALGRRGRVLVRPSGTEPLIRVMAEAETEEAARAAVDDLLVELGMLAE